MSSNSTLSAENLPEVTQEAPLPSPPLAGASEFSSDNGRSLCIATGDKFKTSSNSDRSTETGSTSPTGSGYSRDEEHTVPEQCDPPITEQELQKEETDARALLRSLPEGVAIVNEREIIVGEEIAINNGCVYSAIWNNRRYVLKLGQANFWDEVQSESNLLEGLKSKDRSRRLFAEWIIRGRFLFKQEIRSVLRCHGLPGIARCVAVLISDEVGVQVKGMIMDSFDKGNLMDVCMSTENLPYAWKVDIALQVARTLELIHARKFIHGDVKCINVLMGDNEDVYLCDFGSAASFGDPPPPDNQMQGTYSLRSHQRRTGRASGRSCCFHAWLLIRMTALPPLP
eukprot:jgi/Botrbrau1/15008/Bobra.0018s0107.2